MLIFEMIYIDITYRLYVIIDIIFNSINHNNDCNYVRIVIINVNCYFIVHFYFSNTSNKFISSMNLKKLKCVLKRYLFFFKLITLISSSFFLSLLLMIRVRSRIVINKTSCFFFEKKNNRVV